MKELNTYYQQHQVLEYEAIRVAALHLGGKSYDWWFYETYSSNHINVSTYAKFTRRLVRRFDLKQSKTSLGEKIKPNKSKPLHELEGSMKPNPFQNIVEGVKDLLHALPREKTPLQQELSSQAEDIRIPFSK